MTTYRYIEHTGAEDEIEADSMEEAVEQAKSLLRDGEWGDIERTIYPDARVVAPDGEEEDIEVRIDPKEPDCTADGHHWFIRFSVQGHGGGAITTDACSYCGVYRVIDTWDQSQGPEPVATIRYAEPTPESRDWAVRQHHFPVVIVAPDGEGGFEEVDSLEPEEDIADAGDAKIAAEGLGYTLLPVEQGGFCTTTDDWDPDRGTAHVVAVEAPAGSGEGDE